MYFLVKDAFGIWIKISMVFMGLTVKESSFQTFG